MYVKTDTDLRLFHLYCLFRKEIYLNVDIYLFFLGLKIYDCIFTVVIVLLSS